ncbi:MAG: peptide deformylase [Cyanobacteria bacterium J06628_3]
MPSAIAVEKKKLKNPPLQLHYLGDKILRQPAKRISKVDDEIRKIAREMLQTMYSSDGIGLAAPQVGIHKQLIVIDIEPDNPANPPLILINPVIKKSYGNICTEQEGCLSIPGVYLDVKRPEMVEVSYKDENGRPQTLKAGDLLGRCIQHEMDHLNGVVFVDRVENSLVLTQELSKNGFSHQAVKSIV